MTSRQDLLSIAAQKTQFRDAHDRRSYARATQIALLILETPSLIEQGRAYLDRFVGPDPRQGRLYEVWLSILALGHEQVALRLLADNEEGAYLRATAPVFTVIDAGPERDLSRAAG